MLLFFPREEFKEEFNGGIKEKERAKDANEAIGHKQQTTSDVSHNEYLLKLS